MASNAEIGNPQPTPDILGRTSPNHWRTIGWGTQLEMSIYPESQGSILVEISLVRTSSLPYSRGFNHEGRKTCKHLTLSDSSVQDHLSFVQLRHDARDHGFVGLEGAHLALEHPSQEGSVPFLTSRVHASPITRSSQSAKFTSKLCLFHSALMFSLQSLAIFLLSCRS